MPSVSLEMYGLHLEAGRGRYCPPHHSTHFDPSVLDLNGILCRGHVAINVAPPRHPTCFSPRFLSNMTSLDAASVNARRVI